MTLRFDHAVIAAGDLEAAVDGYRRLGFGVQPGGRHTGKGTRNALIRFPEAYLELIAVDDRDEALAAGPSRVDLVRFLEGAGGGLSTFALRTSGDPHELDDLVLRWRAAGIDVPGPNPAERIRPDGSILRWRTAVPGGSSVRREWPFVIEWPDGTLAPDPSAVNHDNGAMRVTHVAVAGADRGIFDRSAALGFAPDAAGVVSLGGTEVRPVVGPDPGPYELGIAVPDVDGLASMLRGRGIGTTRDGAGSLRLADPDPVTAPLVFVAASDGAAA